MDAPNNNEERQESVSRPLSPAFLDSHAHNWADPPLSEYNQPQFPPTLYDIPALRSHHHIRPIQPFRRYNYLDAQGEDLGSRQYTLGSDNYWELNEILTNAYRENAQDASRLPQFTSVCIPSDIWGLPPAPISYPTITPPTVDELPLSPLQAQWPASPLSSDSRTMSEVRPGSLPPLSSSEPRSSSETPVTLEPEPGPSHRRRRSSASRNTWICGPCNRTFYRKAELDRHIKTASIHQQERRYRCQYCEEPFTRPDAKGRHERMCPRNPDSSGSPKGKGKQGGSSSD
ncbi:unnamed protein product [Rhizoctonia solani]|uniref:C2H2-type domain-containing protein n=1 Tax=Rhizoctonia solani TaxID=456999 RepID=A0A8H2WJG4_9AGAM|nr:unnamed protein product [Rhizoctonia solani]